MRRWTTTLLLATALGGLPAWLVVAAFSSPSAAHAQDSLPDQPLDDARVAAVRPRLLAAAARADAEGLPRAWIDAKVREGLAKRVPPARIAAAVEQLAARMHDAATLARSVPVSGRTEVARAVLDALAVGATTDALAELVRDVAARNRSAAEDVRRALSAVAELGERGFDPGLATRSARAAWRSGGREALRDVVELARRIPRSEAHARGAELTQAAAAPHGRSAERQHGRSDAADRQRPSERGGPPHDDSFTQGASNGRGRALGHIED